MAWRSSSRVVIILAALAYPLAHARACDVPVPPFAAKLESWRQTCPHPLCGRVHATSPNPSHDASLCSAYSWLPLSNELTALKISGGIALLGEVHDNAEHHALRASLLDAPSLLDPRGAIAFEQIRADQQPALDAFAALLPETRTTFDLLRLLDWEKSPWSKTSNYTPLFDAAVASKLPIFAADPPRDLIRAAAISGLSAIPPEERTRLGLDTPLSDAQNAASLAEIEASHCGAIPKSAHPNMAFAQRTRDAHMADALIKAAATNGSAILIAGNGHVRADRGVPWYLHRRAPDKKVISVLFIEVEDGKNDPADYVERDEAGKPTAGYIVFTPRAPRDKDPCDELKAKAKKD